MKQTYFNFFITSIFMLSGCSIQSVHNLGDSSVLYTIDFVQCFDTEKQMLISEISDSIEYLELKTPEDIVIAKIRDIIQIDNYY